MSGEVAVDGVVVAPSTSVDGRSIRRPRPTTTIDPERFLLRSPAPPGMRERYPRGARADYLYGYYEGTEEGDEGDGE